MCEECMARERTGCGGELPRYPKRYESCDTEDDGEE